MLFLPLLLNVMAVVFKLLVEGLLMVVTLVFEVFAVIFLERFERDDRDCVDEDRMDDRGVDDVREAVELWVEEDLVRSAMAFEEVDELFWFDVAREDPDDDAAADKCMDDALDPLSDSVVVVLIGFDLLEEGAIHAPMFVTLTPFFDNVVTDVLGLPDAPLLDVESDDTDSMVMIDHGRDSVVVSI
jgi:hypothetical protein